MSDAKVNKQLWENSPLSALFDEVGLPPEQNFFNSKDPNLAIQHEKPEHRLIIWLKARGHSNTEIAKITGYTIPWIGQVCRQPWAKQRIAELINGEGRNELATIIESAAVDSIYTLIELRDKAENESVRKSAASELLDRYLGKPKQQVDVNNEVTVTDKRMEDLDKEIAATDAELNRLLGKPA